MKTKIAHRWLMVGVVPFSLFLLSGCHSPLFRGQSPDIEQITEEETNGSPLIGDLTFPAGLNYVMVEGVGLVTGLENTGSDPPPSPERDALKSEMQTHDTMRPEAVLASKRTALVMVRGYLPPGVQQGDKIDIEVMSPPRSETTSLQGGWLMQTRLRELAMVNNQVRRGDVDALGGGDVLVNAVFEESSGDVAAGKLKGRVLGGGVATTSRKLGLVLRDNAASVRASTMISASINNRFYHYDSGTRLGVAKPINSKYIELSISPRYRNNVGRYIRVIRSLSLGENATDRAIRMQQLEAKLLEPATASSAALQLEAIGKDGIEVLRKGLRSSDEEVRFYAAEALAYLDDTEAAPFLGKAAASQRAFRWHALAALSTMDHVAAYDALNELLSHPSAEARYGAFRAMQVRNPRDPLVRGEVLGESFAYHVLPATGDPLVHFARTRRPEIVLFGQAPELVPPPFLLAGRHIMIKKHDANQVRVIRFQPGEEDKVIICSTRLDAVIRAIVELGGRYDDVYQALRSAKVGGYLPGRLAVNTSLQGTRSIQRDTGEAGADPNSPTYRVTNPLPELFQDRLEDDGDGAGEKTAGDSFSGESPSPSEKEGFFGTIKGWFSAERSSE